MTNQLLEEGDLIAYLHGEDLPHVEAALAASADLRAEYAQLRRFLSVFDQAFGGIARAEPEEIARAATGSATAEEQLRVMAYVRESAAGRVELEEAQAVIAEFAPRKKRVKLPVFVGVLSLGFGQRGSSENDRGGRTNRTFIAAEIQAQATIYIGSPTNERWRIEGIVTLADADVIDAPVVLRRAGRRLHPHSTDSNGRFSFDRLSAGTYRLEITITNSLFVVPEIVLADDD